MTKDEARHTGLRDNCVEHDSTIVNNIMAKVKRRHAADTQLSSGEQERSDRESKVVATTKQTKNGRKRLCQEILLLRQLQLIVSSGNAPSLRTKKTRRLRHIVQAFWKGAGVFLALVLSRYSVESSKLFFGARDKMATSNKTENACKH